MRGGAILLGSVSLQLLELSQGKDPLAMDEPRFWAAAALRSGTFGLMGDALASTQNQGRGLASYVAGPMVGFLQDTASLTFGNAIDVASGQDAKFGLDALRYVNRYLPGGDLLIIGAAVDRQLFDRLFVAFYPKEFKAMTQYVERSQARRSEGFWTNFGKSEPRQIDFAGTQAKAAEIRGRYVELSSEN